VGSRRLEKVADARERGNRENISNSPKGPRERGVLRVPASQLLRQHYNPFYPWVREKILDAIRTKRG